METQDAKQMVLVPTEEVWCLANVVDVSRSPVGGNKALKARDTRHATVTILEAAGSSATEKEVPAQEQLWMRKLGRKVLTRNDPKLTSRCSLA